MSGIFYYTIGITFTLGIFVRSLYPVFVWEMVLVLTVAFAAAVAWRMKTDSYYSPLFLLSLSSFCFVGGLAFMHHHESHVSVLPNYAGSEVQLQGVIAREPDERATSVVLNVQEDITGELVQVRTDAHQNFFYGDTVVVAGELQLPETFETDLGRTFNYPGYLKARDVETTISFARVEVVERGGGNVVVYELLKFKHWFMRQIESVLPEPQVGLGEGLLLGVKRALGDDLEQIFRSTGIIHIVVLSGYNVMIVAEAIMRLLAVFLSLRARVVVGVGAIAAFALLVGLSATVVRASIMAALVLVARATGRTYAVLRALLLAGVIMLLINPYLLVFDPGFQLSFLATLGLVLVGPHIERCLGLVPSTWQVREFVTATIATQIMVLPLLLFLIGEFSLVAVAVNVLVLPMVPLAMLGTFLTGLATWFTPLATLLGYFTHVMLSYIIFIPESFSRVPYASVIVPAFSFWWVLVAYSGLGYLLWRMKQSKSETVLATVSPHIDLSGWTIVDTTPQTQKPDATLVASDRERSELPFR